MGHSQGRGVLHGFLYREYLFDCGLHVVFNNNNNNNNNNSNNNIYN